MQLKRVRPSAMPTTIYIFIFPFSCSWLSRIPIRTLAIRIHNSHIRIRIYIDIYSRPNENRAIRIGRNAIVVSQQHQMCKANTSK